MFEAPDLVVVTTEVNRAEVEESLPYFAKRYRLDEDLLMDVLELLPVEIYSEQQYRTHVPAARKLVGLRDEDDVALAALALKFRIPIWSNDRDYEGFPYGLLPTARLLKLLGV